MNSTEMLAATMLGVGIVMAVGLLLTPLARRTRQPQVVAEIVVGIILGPSLLGLFPGHVVNHIFPASIRPSLSAIGETGILLFMFAIGWDINPAGIREQRGTIVSVALSSIALPFTLGCALALWLYGGHQTVDHHHVGRLAFILFVGTAMAITAFPVLARIILEHHLQTTRAGTLALAAAAVGDVLAWCMLAFVSIVAAGESSSHLVRILALFAIFIVVLVMAVRPALRFAVDFIDQRSGGEGAAPALTGLVAAGAFVAAYLTSRIGIDPIFGAFSFGLIMPRESVNLMRSDLRASIERLAGFLLPVYFIVTGLSVDIARLGWNGLGMLLAVVAVACLGKVIGAASAARACRMSGRDSLTVGVLMNTRGLTELIVVNAGVSIGVLDSSMFTILVLMALITTALTGILLPSRSSAFQRTPQGTESDLSSVRNDGKAGIPSVDVN